MKEELRAAEDELAAAEAARDAALGVVPNPPDPSRARRRHRGRRRGAPSLRRAADARRARRRRARSAASSSSAPCASPARGSATSSATPPCSRWRSTASRSTTSRRPASRRCCRPCSCARRRWSAPASSPPRSSNIYALEADEPLPHRHLRGRPRRDAHGRDPRGGRAADPLRGLLDLLPPRGGGCGQGHARDVPRAPVQQGRDVRLHDVPRTRATSTTAWSRSRRSSSRQLGLPYRVVNVAAGDLGAPAAKKIDIEAWFPSQERYREVTSCSNTTDYQARRLGIRWRSEHGLEPPHTLNGTVVTDRALLAILENFQGDVPDVLHAYGAPARVER